MCTPSIPKDNSAELAQQQAAQREGAIRQGQGAIDSAAQACERFPVSAWASPLGDLGCKAGVEACCPPEQP